ncbi:MAG TPA: methyltransferase domain-containing protein [Pyrinomonadaceae bacterium]|nr:methyltransferase domain-containing protein [Pyrinomonadaceae bacterium]
MRASLLDILVDPVSKSPLTLVDEKVNGLEVTEGVLKAAGGASYRIRNGIPRFVLTDDAGQRQTEDSFGYKWQRRDAWYSPEVVSACRTWILQRYGFESAEAMRKFFGEHCRVMDAGCGSGFSSSLWIDSSWRGERQSEWIGADISEAIDVAQERLAQVVGTHFVQADILQLPFAAETFDAIFSDGVLHHTPSTERALKSLVPLLTAGGEILFYVYRVKSPLREYTDDFIRDAIAGLEPAEAWEALRPLTKLGQALAELKTEVEVPEDVPLLGIKKGRYDVQRLIYWHFAKLYWRDTFNFEENNHVNFDWYHPRYSWRHTEEEVRRWCDEAGLEITRFDDTQESGFSVRATKR